MSGSNGHYEDDGGSSRPAEAGVRRCEGRCERQSGPGVFPTGESKSVSELAIIDSPCSWPIPVLAMGVVRLVEEGGVQGSFYVGYNNYSCRDANH